MKIYTKTGDDGTTGLQGNKRVSKSDHRIIAYGAVDEINTAIGLALSEQIDDDVSTVLTRIQNELFNLGADLSNPDSNPTKNHIGTESVTGLEEQIDHFQNELKPLANFILPGGTKTAAQIHMARTITRRAETDAVRLAENEKINTYCIEYLNRLSDLLFVLARVINKRNDTTDIIWKL